MVTVPDLDPMALESDALWFVYNDRSEVLLHDGLIPRGTKPPARTKVIHLMGVQDGQYAFTARVEDPDDISDDGFWMNLRRIYGTIDEDEWVLAGRAVQILDWERDHKFCGRCASATEHHVSDRARECPSCGLLSYPRLTPAIIVLVERDDGKVLLAWGRQFPGRFYSALAGFVEPGENFEQAVAREVKEEVGIDVSDVTYFGSQPWPFPNSIMIGFLAKYAGGDLVIDETEIVEADWYGPEDLPPIPRGRMSIAGWLIEDWLARQS